MPLYDASSMEIQRTRIHGIISADTYFEDYLSAHHDQESKKLEDQKNVEKKKE